MAEPVVQENITPLFRPSCNDCAFCDGLKDMGEKDGSPGVIRLEEEENRDVVEDAGNTPGTVKSRRRNTNRRREYETKF